ncbi:MAG: DLW-39 family protein [Pseudonocardiaceae bacterium]
MKKIIPLLLVGLIALILVQRQRFVKVEADLWREATTPTVESPLGALATPGQLPDRLWCVLYFRCAGLQLSW